MNKAFASYYERGMTTGSSNLSVLWFFIDTGFSLRMTFPPILNC